MAAAWNDPWNELTQTVAMMIDNERPELSRCCAMARAVIANREQLSVVHSTDDLYAVERIELAKMLRNWYREKLENVARASSRHFPYQLANALLLQCVSEINWHGLAHHYLTAARGELVTAG